MREWATQGPTNIMSAGQTFTSRSPNQSARMLPFSPTHGPQTYGFDHSYQPPPHTPPAAVAAPLVPSPTFNRTTTFSPPTSHLNGNMAHHHSEPPSHTNLDGTASYQHVSHPYSTSNMPTPNGQSLYNGLPSSHAHPRGEKPESLPSYSPKDEHLSGSQWRPRKSSAADVPTMVHASQQSIQPPPSLSPESVGIFCLIPKLLEC